MPAQVEGVVGIAVAGVLLIPCGRVQLARARDDEHAVARGVGDAVLQLERTAVAVVLACLAPVFGQAVFPALAIFGLVDLQALLVRLGAAQVEVLARHGVLRAQVLPVVDDFAVPGGAVSVFLHLHTRAAGGGGARPELRIGHPVARVRETGVLPVGAVARLPATGIAGVVKAHAPLGRVVAGRVLGRRGLAFGTVALAHAVPVVGVTDRPAGVVGGAVQWRVLLLHFGAGRVTVEIGWRQRLAAIAHAARGPEVPVALRPAGQVAGRRIALPLARVVTVAEILAFGEILHFARYPVLVADAVPVAGLAVGDTFHRSLAAGQQQRQGQDQRGAPAG